MRVAHFGGFAPTASGLYESARDFVRADILAKRDAIFVDIGVRHFVSSQQQPPNVGAKDDRGGWTLEVHGIEDALDADVWVFHADPPLQDWMREGVPPIVWILHGRPLACYRNEVASGGKHICYTHIINSVNHANVKVAATMVEEHLPYWRNVLPQSKLRLIEDPPIDPARFSPEGTLHKWAPGAAGRYNVLIADSWRKDVDIFDTLNAACIAAEKRPGQLKFHIFGGIQELAPPLEPLFGRLRELGALGETHGLEPFLADVYRAADCVLTPHTIPTRIITEALSCGCEVVAGRDCRYTPWHAPADDPEAVARVLLDCLDAVVEYFPGAVMLEAELFNLKTFGTRLGGLYEEARCA